MLISPEHGAYTYSPSELRRAQYSSSPSVLEKLASHTSWFVRARVAGNPNVSTDTLDQLLDDQVQGVIVWAIENTSLTRQQFERVFGTWHSVFNFTNDKPARKYLDIIQPCLAGHKLATIEELAILLKRNQEGIALGVLNNFKNRDRERFALLIDGLLPPARKKFSDWSETEKLAYYRVTGLRYREDTT